MAVALERSPAADQPIVEVRNVSKIYPGGVEALNDLARSARTATSPSSSGRCPR
jgi:hypothetical protein